jgi:uncharacterized protein (DUF2336 family)
VSLPQLEGLDALARREGVDTRPTLVRVLTDLYVQKTPHSAEEERHYTELVLGLLDAVDVPTRAGIAQKLAPYPTPPAMVVRKLARDVIEVAEPVLRHCKLLSGSELLSIIRDCGPSHAAVIATRNQAVQLPAAPPAPQAVVAPPPAAAPAPCAESVDLDAIFTDALDSEPEADATIDRAELAETFFASDAPTRRALLASLSDTANETAVPAGSQASEVVRKLETAALERQPLDFARLLEIGLGVSFADARRITEDPLGEPLLVAARALDMPADVLLRVLLFLNPAIGESVQRVFDLARLYERLSADAALSVVASLRIEARKPRHQPLHYDDEAVRRRGAAPTARRSGTSESRGQLPLRDAVFGARQRTS